MLRSDFTQNLQDLGTENCSMSWQIKKELKSQRHSVFMDQRTMPLGGFLGRESGGQWTRVCVRLSPSLHQKLSQHWSSARLQYKIKDFEIFFLLIYRVSTIPIKALKNSYWQSDPKRNKECKGHRIIEIILEKKSKLEDLLYLISKLLQSYSK